jgi:uncharacterized protein YlxW (UPF0749 family)
MTLLLEAASNPVDPGYADAAARRAAGSGASERPAPVAAVLVALLVAVLTAGTVWAVRELRAPAPEVLQARALLEQEITRRSSAVSALGDENAALSAQVQALADDLLVGDDPAVRALTLLGPSVGTIPVTGPGLVVTLSDSARAQAGDPSAADERVQYVDLQVLTNGLWESGAEAIAINGHRLTALSAVRFAGEAILVELTPLIGPYVVEAVGDPEAMRAAFARTSASRHLALLRDTYGIGAEILAKDGLELPAVALPALRSARTIDSGG